MEEIAKKQQNEGNSQDKEEDRAAANNKGSSEEMTQERTMDEVSMVLDDASIHESSLGEFTDEMLEDLQTEIHETNLGPVQISRSPVDSNIMGANGPQYHSHDNVSHSTSEFTREFNVTEYLRRALQLNEEYRESLKEQIEAIEEAQRRNISLQEQVQLYLAKVSAGARANGIAMLHHYQQQLQQQQQQHYQFQQALQSITSMNRPSNSKKYVNVLQRRTANQYFFVDQNGEQPPENIDTKNKLPFQEKMPLVYKAKKWTAMEKNALRKAIRQQVQERQLAQILQHYQSHSSEDGALKQLKVETEKLKSRNPVEFEKNATQMVQWDLVVKNFVPSRTSYECRKMWENELTPDINKNAWTREEDKKLLKLAQKYKGHSWESVTNELGNGRHALQCFRRYQRSLNVNMMRSKWTRQEDQLLTEAVRQYGERNWQQVANCLEGRTGQQCLHRWMKTLNPKIKRGRWTLEEDKRLLMAVHAYQTNHWIRIQRHIPGRTDVQCRERWCNILNPDLNSGPWTEEEDEKLKAAIQKYGVGKWAKIAEECYPRTDNQCWRRWKVLHADDVQTYRKKILKRDKGMVKNFVGREKERPKLTPDDFELDIKEEREDDDEEEEDDDDDDKEDNAEDHVDDQYNNSRVACEGEGGIESDAENQAHRDKRKQEKRTKKKSKKTTDKNQQALPPRPPAPNPAQYQRYLAIEFQRQWEIRNIQNSHPLFVGIANSPFVNESVKMLKYLRRYIPEERKEVSKILESPIFTKSFIWYPSNSGFKSLPAIPPTRLSCHALSTLSSLLYDPQFQFNHLDQMAEAFADSDRQLSLDEVYGDGEDSDDGDDDYNYSALQGSGGESTGIPFQRVSNAGIGSTSSTAVSSTNSQAIDPNNKPFEMPRLFHLNPEVIKSEKFKELVSVFNAMFGHPLLRVMNTTSAIKPHLLRRKTKPLAPYFNLIPSIYQEGPKPASGDGKGTSSSTLSANSTLNKSASLPAVPPHLMTPVLIMSPQLPFNLSALGSFSSSSASSSSVGSNTTNSSLKNHSPAQRVAGKRKKRESSIQLQETYSDDDSPTVRTKRKRKHSQHDKAE